MKKLFFSIAILFCVGASAQTTMVYDTTVVRTPLTVAPKSGAGQRDSLYMPPATTAVNGYMTAASMANIANLQTSMTTANTNISTLQTQVATLSTIPATNIQTGTTYTLLASDNNKTIIMTNTAACTITLPTGLPDGWKCTVIQAGGTITYTTATGVTRRSYSNYTRSQFQFQPNTIYSTGSNVVYLMGYLKA